MGLEFIFEETPATLKVFSTMGLIVKKSFKYMDEEYAGKDGAIPSFC